MEHQTVIVLETHPAVVNTTEPGYNVATDWPEGVAELRRILDASPKPLFIVHDLRAITLSINGLILASNQGTRGERPVWRHPNSQGVYFISEDKTIALAVAGMNTQAFGNMIAKVFPTIEQALADIEQVMAR